MYKLTNNEIVFDAEKMRRFAEKDVLLRFVINDLKKRGHDEESALQATFYGYVVEDFAMEKIYQTL